MTPREVSRKYSKGLSVLEVFLAERRPKCTIPEMGQKRGNLEPTTAFWEEIIK
jgi:hypothetical protein